MSFEISDIMVLNLEHMTATQACCLPSQAESCGGAGNWTYSGAFGLE